MSADEAGQSQIEDLGQALVRVHISRALSVVSAYSQSVPSPTPQQKPSASAEGPLTPARATFLGLPLEIRDMIYGLILTVDPNPSLIEHDEEAYRFPDTQLFHVNAQVRREASEVLRSNNTWVMLVVISQSGEFDTQLHPHLCFSQALFMAPVELDEQRGFLQKRSIIINIGLGCGSRNTRPLLGDHHTATYLFAYNRQGFAYFCLRLWQCADVYNDMTVILHMPHPPPGNPRIVQSMMAELASIRGLQSVACLGFPQPQQGQLERHMMTRPVSRRDVFSHLRMLSDHAEAAVSTGQREEAIHRYRMACLTSNLMLKSVRGSLVAHRPYQNACARINVEFSYKKCAAILEFVGNCWDESNNRFANLSAYLFKNAVHEANLAMLGFPGSEVEFRLRAHQLRGNALRERANHGRMNDFEAAAIRSNLVNGALDFYFASLLVDRTTNPGLLEVDRSLTHVEEELGTTNINTIAQAEIQSIIEPVTGVTYAMDVRLLRGWNLTARQFMDRLPGWRVFPSPTETMGLI